MSDFFKVRFAIFVVVLLGFSVFKSCEEARYTLFGKTTEVTDASARLYTTRSRRGGERTKLEITYKFDDDGKVRSESDTVDPTDDLPDPLRVQYIPGSTDSRIEGHTERWWLIVLGIAMAAGVWQVVKFVKFYRS